MPMYEAFRFYLLFFFFLFSFFFFPLVKTKRKKILTRRLETHLPSIVLQCDFLELVRVSDLPGQTSGLGAPSVACQIIYTLGYTLGIDIDQAF
jgi:hypothetical protein